MPEWFEQLGFDYDPFVRPGTTRGYDEELKEIFYSITAGNIIFVEGSSGSGKTSLLREAVLRFGGRKQVIYFNCRELRKELNVEGLLKGRYGFWGRLFNIKPKNMILLLDEIEHLSERNGERIKYYYDNNYLRSVVFAGKAFDNAGLNASIRQRIHKIIALRPLSDLDAVKVVREKIGDKFLPDRAVKMLYHQSGKNMGRMLESVQSALKHMAANNLKTLDEEGLKKAAVIAQ